MRKGLFILIAGLAGCAGPLFYGTSIAPGSSRQAVVERLGPPTRVVPLAGGERLQYSLQPLGRYAWMVDLDASGRVVQSRQVLTESNFHRIEPGKWTRADVEREFGPPAWIDGVASWNGPIMNYRWRNAGNVDMFYWVYLDERDVVRRAHPGMDFVNTPDDRRF